MVGISQSLDGMMEVSTYDPDVDGKIALAEMKTSIHTLPEEAVVFQGRAEEQSSVSQTYALYDTGFAGFVCWKGGDYRFSAELKSGTINYDSVAGYRINGGDWVDFATRDQTSYAYALMAAAITLKQGDMVEFGLRRNTSAAVTVYMQSFRIYLSKIDRIT